MKRTPILLTILCFFAVMVGQVVRAQDSRSSKAPINVTGNWDVTIKFNDHTAKEKWTLKQVGEKITGTAKGDKGDQTVTGDMVTKIFLRVVVKDGDMENKVRASANDNNSMDGAITIGTAEYLWAATRAK